LLAKADREVDRMPTSAEKRELLERDGFHCRFCGIPVIRPEVRRRIRKHYADALPWGRSNASQHAAFQAMWVQYDHVVPHSRGGGSDLDNLVIACAPCNFGRMEYALEEVGLIDPRERAPIRSAWSGLERFR
jgi:5-methylcytosine-specific restriction endonuclease McrA